MAAELIAIEVAYADTQQQTVIPLRVPPGSSVSEAVQASGILNQFPEIALTEQKIGIFSQLCGLDTVVNAGDRIEIYRPLLQDPMQARRQRLRK